MYIKIVKLTEIGEGKFDLALQIDDDFEKLQVSIFDVKGIFGIESGEFEKILIEKLPTGKKRQELIGNIKRKYYSLKKLPEFQAA